MIKHIISFKSRAKRKEFWIIQAIVYAMLIIISLLVLAVVPRNINSTEYMANIGLISMLLMIPIGIINWAVIVRRFHDFNVSGWYSLILILLIALDRSGISSLIFTLILGSIPSAVGNTRWSEKEA